MKHQFLKDRQGKGKYLHGVVVSGKFSISTQILMGGYMWRPLISSVISCDVMVCNNLQWHLQSDIHKHNYANAHRDQDKISTSWCSHLYNFIRSTLNFPTSTNCMNCCIVLCCSRHTHFAHDCCLSLVESCASGVNLGIITYFVLSFWGLNYFMFGYIADSMVNNHHHHPYIDSYTMLSM